MGQRTYHIQLIVLIVVIYAVFIRCKTFGIFYHRCFRVNQSFFFCNFLCTFTIQAYLILCLLLSTKIAYHFGRQQQKIIKSLLLESISKLFDRYRYDVLCVENVLCRQYSIDFYFSTSYEWMAQTEIDFDVDVLCCEEKNYQNKKEQMKLIALKHPSHCCKIASMRTVHCKAYLQFN